VAEGD